MVLGFFLSFIICGGFAFIISRLALSAGLDKENRFLAGLFYFLAPFLSKMLLNGSRSLDLPAKILDQAIQHNFHADPSRSLSILKLKLAILRFDYMLLRVF